MIEVVKPGAVAQGQQRLIVRGSNFLSLDRAAALRAFYNEYPERFPLDPNFPGPGRRGGSPAPKSTGVVPGAGGSPGQEGGEEPSTGGRAPRAPSSSPLTYPSPRDREGAADLVVGGSLPPAGSAAASSVQNCAGQGGDSSVFNVDVAAGVTSVRVSKSIPGPFIIRHVGWFCTVDNGNSFVRIKIALDNDTSGGVDTTGQLIPQASPGTSPIGARVGSGDFYPNNIWTAIPAYLKMIFVNGSAGTIGWWVAIDFEYLT